MRAWACWKDALQGGDVEVDGGYCRISMGRRAEEWSWREWNADAGDVPLSRWCELVQMATRSSSSATLWSVKVWCDTVDVAGSAAVDV